MHKHFPHQINHHMSKSKKNLKQGKILILNTYQPETIAKAYKFREVVNYGYIFNFRMEFKVMLNKRSFTFGNYKEIPKLYYHSAIEKVTPSNEARRQLEYLVQSTNITCYECTGFYGYDRSLIKCGASVYIMNEKAQYIYLKWVQNILCYCRNQRAYHCARCHLCKEGRR